MEDIGKEEVLVGRYIIKAQKYYYTKDHVWVLVKGNIARVGITDYAQFQIDVVEQIQFPHQGDYLEPQDTLCQIEGLKGMFEVICPLSGSVEQVNTYLEDNPSLINEDPYEDGWLVELRMSDQLEIEDLMTAEDYIEYVEDIVKAEGGSSQFISTETIEEESIEELSDEEFGYKEEK